MSTIVLSPSSIVDRIKRLIKRESLADLDVLDQPFRAALLSLYRREAQIGDGGQTYAMEYPSTKISPRQGLWLYDLNRMVKPKATLEIGLAYGFSMLFFLAALNKNGRGQHTAIDPFPWHGIAAAKAREVGMPIEIINELSECAGVDLRRNQRKFDIIFIDGMHRFDNALIDFTLFARLCTTGGYIILDDMWMRSIKTVVEFIGANRKDFVRVPAPIRNIAAFRKIGEDERKWDHFRNF